jgi:hypothetical protein
MTFPWNSELTFTYISCTSLSRFFDQDVPAKKSWAGQKDLNLSVIPISLSPFAKASSGFGRNLINAIGQRIISKVRDAEQPFGCGVAASTSSDVRQGAFAITSPADG